MTIATNIERNKTPAFLSFSGDSMVIYYVGM